MKTILFFDTETTGKANYKAPFSAPGQPRVVSFAGLLCDETGAELSSLYVLVKPVGFEIPAEATAIHGITTEKAIACGVPALFVCSLYAALTHNAVMIGGHNTEYDRWMMAGECERMLVPIPPRPALCTMRLMTPVCRIPKAWRDPADPFKWPSLEEAFEKAFGVKPEGQHDALADVRNTKKLYFWYRAMKLAKENQPAPQPQIPENNSDATGV